MALTRADKEQIISGFSDRMAKAKAAFLVDYKGMTVSQVTNLRGKLYEAGSEMKVVRNTLALRGLSDYPTEKEFLQDKLVGTNAFVFAYEDAGASAKALKDFSDEVDHLELKTGVMSGEGLDADKIKYLATLPPKDVLRAQLLGVFQAPTSKFVRTLAAVPGGFARVLNAYKEKQEGNN